MYIGAPGAGGMTTHLTSELNHVLQFHALGPEKRLDARIVDYAERSGGARRVARQREKGLG
jgi:hypothetical protein